MNMNKTALALLMGSLFVAGCTPLKVMDHKEDSPYNVTNAQKEVEAKRMWTDPPVVTEGAASLVLLTPQAIPENIRKRQVVLQWDTAVTVRDVMATLSQMGIQVVSTEQTLEDKTLYLPQFNGNVGQLLGVVSRATNSWFTWEDGVMLASSKIRIGVSLPQEKEFATLLAQGLKDIGIDTSAVTWEAGLMFTELTPSEFQKFKLYLQRLTANAAVVNLQVSVVNVTLNQNAKQGIDWDGLTIAATSGAPMANIKAMQGGSLLGGSTGTTTTGGTTSNNGTTTGTTTGSTTTGTTSDAVQAITSTVGAVQFAGQALSGAVLGKRFNITGMFNFLQSYGDAQTDQSVMLKTVTGKKVSFKSLIQVPYVAEIGNSNSSNSNYSSSSTRTEKADDGIEVELTPTYDSSSNTVTIGVTMGLKAVLGFNELSAGNQLGTLSQPTTATRDLEGTVITRPGETAVIGGLTYNSVSDNRAGPTFLQKGSKLESQSITVSRQTMFIVLRPTIVKLGNLEIDVGRYSAESLNFLPTAKK